MFHTELISSFLFASRAYAQIKFSHSVYRLTGLNAHVGDPRVLMMKDRTDLHTSPTTWHFHYKYFAMTLKHQI